jgi:hypothetical protein
MAQFMAEGVDETRRRHKVTGLCLEDDLDAWEDKEGEE